MLGISLFFSALENEFTFYFWEEALLYVFSINHDLTCDEILNGSYEWFAIPWGYNI